MKRHAAAAAAVLVHCDTLFRTRADFHAAAALPVGYLHACLSTFRVRTWLKNTAVLRASGCGLQVRKLKRPEKKVVVKDCDR